MTTPSPQRISFIADLHLFSRRSRGEHFRDQLLEESRNSDMIVLGGDIFDYRWSTFGCESRTSDAAIRWLEDFTDAANCDVHLLLGNHDDHPYLIELLPGLADQKARFFWDRYMLRIEDTVFMHGDVADRQMTAACLTQARSGFCHRPRASWRHHLYDLAIQAQLHRLTPPAVYPKKRVARRILGYLDSLNQGIDSGLKHVYFGHTHRPLDGYMYQNVAFHNCGAPIGRAQFRILHRALPRSQGNS